MFKYLVISFRKIHSWTLPETRGTATTKGAIKDCMIGRLIVETVGSSFRRNLAASRKRKRKEKKKKEDHRFAPPMRRATQRKTERSVRAQSARSRLAPRLSCVSCNAAFNFCAPREKKASVRFS